jgi:hypothetical protein
MTITEKKPLIIQIPGEITPNELPVSASAVGYDFIQGNYLIYATGSDSWVTAPPNTAGIQEYWQSTVNNNIFTTGSINGSSTITATTGFSGSLTKLTDGSDYLIAGTNIQLSTGSNGAITIAATGGGGAPGGSNTQIQYNNSGSFGGVTNLTWDGATLNATGSFKGNLDGTASYATNAATASYVLNAVTASYATVAVSLTTNVFNVALNGTANGISTNIGGIYIPASTTVTTKSLAYIGGSTVSEVAVLKLVPINSVTVSASWVVTGTLTSVSLSSPVTLGPGWYDLTLETGTVSQTAFGRGLYLTSGDI